MVEHLLDFAGAHPLATAIVSVLIVWYLWRAFRKCRWPQFLRAEPRTFTAYDKREGLLACSDRCEWVTWYGNRCNETEHLAADHHYPWSKGGKTVPSNLVLLCRLHNGKKTNKWPTPYYTMRIALSRKRYFPAGRRCTPRRK